MRRNGQNIEAHLSLLGFDIPTLEYEGVGREYLNRENGIINRYTPAAIWQDFRWYQEVQSDAGIVDFNNSGTLAIETIDGLIDLHLGGFVPVSRERFIARRQQIYNLISRAFEADCITITLGMIEAWYDCETGLYIHGVPAGRHFQNMHGRFEFHVLSYSQCYDSISSTVNLIHTQGRGKILLTTSPVPLARTFTDQDVIAANMFSKSLLRTVCGEIVAKSDGVDYFPAFEAVQGTRDWGVYAKDRVHVTSAFVGKIVSALAEKYFCLDRENMALHRAAILASAKKWPSALDALSGAGEFRNDQARIIAGLIYGNNDRQQLAIELLKEVDEASLPPRLWPQYVDATLAAEMTAVALTFSQDRIQHPRANANIPLKIGDALMRGGRRREARTYLNEVISVRPKNLAALQLIADMDAEENDAVHGKNWTEQVRKLFSGTG